MEWTDILCINRGASISKPYLMNKQKYKRLVSAGAHAITADFTNMEEILEWI